MNKFDKIELSKRVAEKYGVEDYVVYGVDDYGADLPFTWLADDSARCFELAVDVGLMIQIQELDVAVIYLGLNYHVELFSDHADAKEATRIAILKCLDEMKGE